MGIVWSRDLWESVMSGSVDRLVEDVQRTMQRFERTARDGRVAMSDVCDAQLRLILAYAQEQRAPDRGVADAGASISLEAIRDTFEQTVVRARQANAARSNVVDFYEAQGLSVLEAELVGAMAA